MDIYKASVSFDGVAITRPVPAHRFPFLRTYLMATNVPPGGAFVDPSLAVPKGFGVRCQVYDNTFGEYSTEYQPIYFNDTLINASFANPDTWSNVFIDVAGSAQLLVLDSGLGTDGAAYTGGGTMEVEKDEAAGVMRFITPMGTMVVPLQYTGGTFGVTNFDEQNSNGVYFIGHGHHMWRAGLVPDDQRSELHWYNAINRKNAAITLQVDMSSADPGSWYPTDVITLSSEPTPPGFAPGGLAPMETADLQEATRYRMKITWTSADDVPDSRSSFTQHVRILSNGGTGQNFRDMTHAPEHGGHWAVYVLPSDISKIKLRQTHDNFHSVVVTNAYDSAPSANENPNITWFRDRLWLVWYDGSVVKQSFSQDWGTNWSTPVDLTLSGTNPRHLVDPNSGTSYYFYIDSAQSLVLRRSGDFGKSFWDASAITVQTNVGLQTVAAHFTSSGEVVVGWIDAMSGDWTQLRSQDRGTTWI